MKLNSCLLVAPTLLLASTGVFADQITNTYAFNSATTETQIVKTSSIFVDQFDSSLGTLNSVGVSISGGMNISMLTQLHLVPVEGAGAGPIFVENIVDFFPHVKQLFAAQTNELFQFGTPADMMLHGLTGGGGLWTWSPTFSYSFSLDSAGFSGLSMQATGVQAYTPPSTINGSLDSFIADAGSALNLYPIQFTDMLIDNPFDYLSFTSTTAGEMTITYDYTPGSTTGGDNGSTVPLPPTALLIATGLGLLGFTRRNRKAS